MERQFNACQSRVSIYLYILNSFPVIGTASAKNTRFGVAQPTFLLNYFDRLFPGNAPVTITIYKKRVGCLLNPHSMYLSVFN